jgi:ATP-dependent Clp protease ATP-binding subunit ClpA
MLSRNLEQTLHRALGLANERRHEYATLEHLLLALTDDGDATNVLRACGVDVEKLKRDLTEFLDKDSPGLVAERSGDPKPTAGFQRVVQRAAIHVQSSGRDEVTGANVLVALFSERESHAVYFLQLQDMTRLDAVNFISHGICQGAGPLAGLAPRPGTPSKPRGAQVETEGDALRRPGRGQDALVQLLASNLNKKAQLGPKIDPLIGRDSRSSARSRSSAAAPRTTRSTWAIPASARPPSPRSGQAHHRGRRARGAAEGPPSSRSTWAACSPAPRYRGDSRSG